MKKILFILFAVFTLTSCSDDEIVKTEGELIGEKIIEYVNQYNLTEAYFIEPRPYNDGWTYYFYSHPFKIEGQYAYCYDNTQTIIYNLNRVVKFEQKNKKLVLYFDEYNQGSLQQ